MSADLFDSLVAALPKIFEGVWVTFKLTLGGAVLAFALAVSLGLLARHKNILLRGLGRFIIEFFRGTSLVVQLFWFFFVLPQFGMRIDPMIVGVIALGLNYGAYSAEVVRGSINSVEDGQWEAATALSLSRTHRMWHVIFPQAWALMIPSLNNLLIQLLKGTAIVSFITLHDLTYQIDKLRVDTNTFFAYTVGLVLYFLLAYLFTLFMNGVEIRAKHRLGMGKPLREVLSFRRPNTDSAGPGAGVQA